MTETRIFPTDDALGLHASTWILQRLLRAQERFGHMVLGCPSGRSPRSTYAALAQSAAKRGIDLSRLHIVMMDEFVAPDGKGWALCPADAHFSCARFGEVEIRRQLNDVLPVEHQVPLENLHVPDPNNPAEYESLIDRLGGIDVFILASGASDGHVAFNPPGSTADLLTRVVRLAETTRQDNLATFPDFSCLEAVPYWGVTVGPGTIARASRSAIMILSGPAKAHAYRRITSSQAYESDWPATVINLCADAAIFSDSAATGSAASDGN